MVDPLTVLSITGRQLLDALENGVSQYPRLEGRFPQVSGFTFMFDPKRSRPSGHRIQENSVTIQGETIDYDKVPHVILYPYIIVYINHYVTAILTVY